MDNQLTIARFDHDLSTGVSSYRCVPVWPAINDDVFKDG